MARHLHLDEGKVMVSLAKFRSKNGLWKGAGVWASAEHITAAIRGGSRICGKGGGAAAVPFEDPLWNFKGGGRRGRAPSLALLEDPLWNFKRGGARPLRPPP